MLAVITVISILPATVPPPPNDPITREQAAVMLCSAFGLQPSGSAALTYADSASISSWDRDAMAALAERGMMTGVGTVSTEASNTNITVSGTVSNVEIAGATYYDVLWRIEDTPGSGSFATSAYGDTLTLTEADVGKYVNASMSVKIDEHDTMTPLSDYILMPIRSKTNPG